MTKSRVWIILGIIISVVIAWILVNVLFSVMWFVFKLAVVAGVALIVFFILSAAFKSKD